MNLSVILSPDIYYPKLVMTPRYLKFFTTVIILTLVSACATNIAGRKQFMLVSESSAIESSRQAYINTLEPFKKEGKLDNNSAIVCLLLLPQLM